MLLAALFPVALAVEGPSSLREALDDASVEERALRIEDRRVALPGGELRIDEGTVFPLLSVEGRVHELIFVGSASFSYATRFDIEAYQLELMTGAPAIDSALDAFVLAAGDAALLDALLDGEPVEAPANERRIATYLAEQWHEPDVRAAAGLLPGLARALWDESEVRYVALWARSEVLGSFLYRIDPAEAEAITLDGFEVEIDDEGASAEVTSWCSHSLRTERGRHAGDEGFEPSHYRLEVAIPEWEEDTAPFRDEEERRAFFRTPIYRHLEVEQRVSLAATDSGRRVARFTLHHAAEVEAVRLSDGSALDFASEGSDLVVLLPRAAAVDVGFTVEIDYGGPLLHDLRAGHIRMRAPIRWHPHIGSVDRATYDVGFAWPAEFELIAGGSLIDEGTEDGCRFERRELTVPAIGFGFEMGAFDVQRVDVDGIELTVAFSKYTITQLRTRDEVVQVARASVAFFRGIFGDYPLDSLTVAVVPQPFSQGKLGFVTLSMSLMGDTRDVTSYAYFDDRRSMRHIRMETVAHEIAHQWWGNKVGWESYRDQWLSEALADYAAHLFMVRASRGRAEAFERRARAWRASLARRTETGREFEQLGPVVLGTRLARNHGMSAYSAVVYDKGSAVFATLARQIGEERLVDSLRRIADAVDHGVVGTESFFRALEQATGESLIDFRERFVYGTGMPRLNYDYRVEQAADGGWHVRGRVELQEPRRYRYELDERLVLRRRALRDDGGSDGLDLTIPFQVAFADAQESARELRDGREVRRGAGGEIRLTGRSTEFDIALERQPQSFFLDQRGEIFAGFVHLDEGSAARTLQQGLDRIERGEHEAAIELLERAASDEAAARLALARLHLDRGENEAARAQLEQLDERPDDLRRERVLLWARLELAEDDARRAYRRLRDFLLPKNSELRALDFSELDRWYKQDAESFAIFAVAAHLSGHPRWAERACGEAERRGAGMAALRALLR